MNVKQLTDELCWPDGHGEKRCRLQFTSLPLIKLYQPTLIKPIGIWVSSSLRSVYRRKVYITSDTEETCTRINTFKSYYDITAFTLTTMSFVLHISLVTASVV
jgi:hypothetical protein